MSASWTHSSATSKSPRARTSAAVSRPASSRKTSATAASVPKKRSMNLGIAPSVLRLSVLFAVLGLLVVLDARPDLDAAAGPGLRERDRVVQVLGLDDGEPAHGLLRLEERAVGHEGLAVLLPDRRRRPRGLELLAALEVAVLRVLLPPLPDRLVGVHGRGRAVGFAEALVVDEQEYVLGHWLPLLLVFSTTNSEDRF